MISQKGTEKGKWSVSHEWLYHWIWDCKRGSRQRGKDIQEALYTHIKNGRIRRKRGNQKYTRGIIPGRTPISKRPNILDRRTRLGNVEVDLMIGRDYKCALLVMTDRTIM